MVGPTGVLTTIGCMINYPCDLLDWLEGVYMCQNDTCEITSQSVHPFTGYAQKSKYRSVNYFSGFAENWLRGAVFSCVRMTPVESFVNQTIHSKARARILVMASR